MADREQLEARVADLEAEVARLRRATYRGLRKRSSVEVAGLPLWAVALGPDPEKGELRGHAKAIIAVGDMATGVVAVGGLARGVVALGGLAFLRELDKHRPRSPHYLLRGDRGGTLAGRWNLILPEALVTGGEPDER